MCGGRFVAAKSDEASSSSPHQVALGCQDGAVFVMKDFEVVSFTQTINLLYTILFRLFKTKMHIQRFYSAKTLN